MQTTEDELRKAIEQLDLSSVKEKMRHRKSWWWKLWNNLDSLEREYRQFLFLIATNRGKTIVPWSQPLDDFWHEHILNTSKYASDCQAIFGEYIHHNPSLNKGSAPHSQAVQDTRKMYREAYTQQRTEDVASCSFFPDVSDLLFTGYDHGSHDHGSHDCGDHGSHGDAVGCGGASCSSSSCSSSSCGSSCGSGCGGGGD